MMKIISVEAYNSNIEHSLRKDLLIPCFMYKIPVETSKNNDLNFIEKSILKLIEIDATLKGDIDRLSHMLGFCIKDKYNKCIENDSDKRTIVELILRKIKDLRIDENSSEEKTEVTIYQFYQEAYTNELLPIVTKEINEYSYQESNFPYEKSVHRQIKFKKDIKDKKQIYSILATGFTQNKPSKPRKQEFIKAIYMHNQNSYNENDSIDFKDFNIEVLEPELVYIHTKLYILQNTQGSFTITNGFTNDFSTHLRKIFEDKYQDLLRVFRQETKVDSDKKVSTAIKIPFNDKINRYSDVKNLIQNIERESLKIKQDRTDSNETKYSKDRFAQSLYDLIEKTFSVLSKDCLEVKSLKDRELLNTLAKNIGFEIPEEYDLPIFKVHDNDNLQKYFAKTLIYKKDELYEISLRYPNLLFILKNLFQFRNGLKHSQKEETLKRIAIDKLFEYKDIIYDVISIVLHIEFKTVKNNAIDNDDAIHMNNAYLDLEEEFNIDIMDQFPQEIKDNLTELNYFINMDFEQNKRNIIEKVINNLYSSFELILRKKINDLPDKSSLGYIANCLDKIKHTDDEEKLIKKIVKLRGHGSPSLEDVDKIVRQELIELKNQSFMYIKQLMEI